VLECSGAPGALAQAMGVISERVGLEATPEALVRLRTPDDLLRMLTRPWN
jgi:hypothetical protein